ncbi:hypothetical protein JXL83_01265 [candidate division WOR-3 bacterium]|nr:hypothetical protein [candidate division WOR-3 bacterium]
MLSHLLMLVCYFTVSFPVNPVATSRGMVFTDSGSKTIYLVSERGVLEIFKAPGCGMYMSTSPSGRLIGFKYIDRQGMQVPAAIDIENLHVTEFYQPCSLVGQVSFSALDKPAFTIGNELVFESQDGLKRFDLGFYSNLCPVSADGNFAVFNDYNDALWILNLENGEKKRITPPGTGYCCPVWSRDGEKILFRGISGNIYVWTLENSSTVTIEDGFNPCFSPDGRYILYEKRFHAGQVLVNSDLYIWDTQISSSERMTFTENENETYPVYLNERQIAFVLPDRNEIVTAFLSGADLLPVSRISLNEDETLPIENSVKCTGKGDSLDVTYIHQVYDSPDWFNGHWACAPSAALMVVSYYGLLPAWKCQCSSPYSHESFYGRYICERYMFNEFDYNLAADDPVGTPSYGGYGYMWTGSYSPYSRMVQYYLNHGLSASRDDTPTFGETVNELNAGYPYSMCVGLTTSGHLVLAVGQVLNWHTIIFNDPYGNKNTAGYPSYDGKYARYDWPGYNNGNQNLNQVYWCVSARGTFPDVSDTLIDDRHLTSGFYLHAENPSSMKFWRDAFSGYENHSWWTYSTQGTQDTCYATWTPALAEEGIYEVSIYIPVVNSGAVSAVYRIYHPSGPDTVVIDQSQNPGQWVSLGSFFFDTSGGYIYLGDKTGYQGQRLAFDAVKFSLQESGTEEEIMKPQTGFSAYFSGEALIICLQGLTWHELSLNLYDSAGRLVFSGMLEEGISRTGNLNLSPGPYFLVADFGAEKHVVKLCKLF